MSEDFQELRTHSLPIQGECRPSGKSPDPIGKDEPMPQPQHGTRLQFDITQSPATEK